MYGRYQFDIDESEEEISVDGTPVARKNVLIEVHQAGSSAASGKVPRIRATRITQDLVRDGLVLLKQGEVFDAPFSRLVFSWGAEPIPSLLRRITVAVRSALRPGRLASEQAEYLEASIATARDSAVEKESVLAALPAREREVAELLRCGRSRREIAQRLYIALPTVKRHAESVYRKLGVHSRYELMALLNDG